MDPVLRRQLDVFKKKSIHTPSVEARPTKSSNSNSAESFNKPRPAKRAKVDDRKKDFDYKTVSARSDSNFAILARVVNHLKKRHLEGDTEALSLEDMCEELDGMILTPRQKHFLTTEALVNNPKVEVVDGIRFRFKSIFSLRNVKELRALLRRHDRDGLGGVLAEDVEESMPNFAKHMKAWRDNLKDTIVLEDLLKRPPDELTDEDKKKMEEIRRKAALVEAYFEQIIVIVRLNDKKEVLYYKDKSREIIIDDDILSLYRTVSTEGVDERKIEEYLRIKKIVSMRDLGIKKPVMKKKVAKKRKLAYKTHNPHVEHNFKDYTEK